MSDDNGTTTMDGLWLIHAERIRSINTEGYTAKHDDQHRNGELALAAARYALDTTSYAPPPYCWPYGWEYKPETPLRNLVKAGNLIAAEIDRRLRKGESLDGGHGTGSLSTENSARESADERIIGK